MGRQRERGMKRWLEKSSGKERWLGRYRDTEMDEQRTGGIGGKDNWQWVEQWRDWMVCRTKRQPGERTSQRN